MSHTATRTKFFDAEQYTIILPPKERMRLAILAKNGDNEACTKLIFGMTRLILDLAIKDYRIPLDQLEDVVQEVYLELFKLFSIWQPKSKTIPKFKPELGNNPITYAYPYIKKTITEYMAKNRSFIGLPKKSCLLIKKIEEFLSSQENLSQKEIDEYINRFISGYGMMLKTFLSAFRAYRVLSLDKEIRNRGRSVKTLLDTIPNSQEDHLEMYVIEEKRAELLYSIIDKVLSPREALIIRLRYGPSLTLDKIGKIVGKIEYIDEKTGKPFRKSIGKERVRQLIKLSKSKLKDWMNDHPQDKKVLYKLFVNTNGL